MVGDTAKNESPRQLFENPPADLTNAGAQEKMFAAAEAARSGISAAAGNVSAALHHRSAEAKKTFTECKATGGTDADCKKAGEDATAEVDQNANNVDNAGGKGLDVRGSSSSMVSATAPLPLRDAVFLVRCYKSL